MLLRPFCDSGSGAAEGLEWRPEVNMEPVAAAAAEVAEVAEVAAEEEEEEAEAGGVAGRGGGLSSPAAAKYRKTARPDNRDRLTSYL